MKRQNARDQAAKQTSKVACKRTAANAEKSGEKAPESEPQNARKSKSWALNGAINAGKSELPSTKHRFEARASLQSHSEDLAGGSVQQGLSIATNTAP